MKKISVFALTLWLLVTTVSLCSRGVTLSWCPSSDTNVTGYAIYYGTGNITNWSPDVYSYSTNNPCDFTLVSHGSNWLGNYPHRIDVGNTDTATITNLIPATYYFVAVATNADGLESIPSNEVTYTVPYAPTNPPPKVTYFGTRLEWWTNVVSINRQNFNLMSFTNPPNGQFYRSFLILTNRRDSPMKIVDLKTRLEWWTNMAYINTQVFDLKSFTNPPNPQFHRAFLVITNNPF